MRALAKDPGQRFATMREFGAALVSVDSELARPAAAVMRPQALPMLPPQAMPTGPHPRVGTGPQPIPRRAGSAWNLSTLVIAWLVALILGLLVLIVIKLAIM
jgi:hypothetical protein